MRFTCMPSAVFHITMSENFNDIEKPSGDNSVRESGSDPNSNNVGDGSTMPVVTDAITLAAVPKHPLQHKWTLWYFENDRNKDWEKNQREVTSFSSVEDFWSIYMHVKPAGDLRQGCDYSLFKQGIRPMWEDMHNKRGGRWLISLEKKQRTSDLDKFWLETLLCLIGEAFEHADEVCGAVVNVRGKGDKLALWTADANNTNAVMEIGQTLKERLNIAPKILIGYQIHKDTMVKQGSVTKNTYTV